MTSSQGESYSKPPNSSLLVSPWYMQAMKDKLLPEILGATLPCLLRPVWRDPEKTLTSPHKAIYSAWIIFLAKHDSSSVSKVASGECSLHQCEMQNDLIQAAASVWIETISSDIRRSAVFLVIARDHGKQELFSLCAFYVSGAQLRRDASVLCLGTQTTSLAFPATVFAFMLWKEFAFSFTIFCHH